MLSLSTMNFRYFQNNVMGDENANYMVRVSSHLDLSRDFITAIFKRYETVAAFNWDNIGNEGYKHTSEILDEAEIAAETGTCWWLIPH